MSKTFEKLNERRPLQNSKKVVILSIAKNLNMLNSNYLQILHKLFRFAQDDIFQNDKNRSFAKVLKDKTLVKYVVSLDSVPISGYKGVEHIHLREFLQTDF